MYLQQLNGQTQLLQLRGEVVHPDKFVPLLLDTDRRTAYLLDTLIYFLVSVEGQLRVEEILNDLINMVVLALSPIKLLSDAKFLGLERYVYALLLLFESFGRQGPGFDLNFPPFEEHFSATDGKDVQDISREHN